MRKKKINVLKEYYWRHGLIFKPQTESDIKEKNSAIHDFRFVD